MNTKLCPVCGRDFTVGFGGERPTHSKYCSEDCLNIMRRRKQKEKAAVYSRAYAARHPDRQAYSSKKYLQSEKGIAAKREYESRDYVRFRRQLKDERRGWADRWDAMVHYSGDPPFCACCGEDHPFFLCIDHINGGGNKHRRANNVWHLPRWVKQNGYPEGFQVLCANCNSAKAWHGECPHETERRLLSGS